MEAEKSGSEFHDFRPEHPRTAFRMLSSGVRSLVMVLLCSGCVPSKGVENHRGVDKPETAFCPEIRHVEEPQQSQKPPREMVIEFHPSAYHSFSRQGSTLPASFRNVRSESFFESSFTPSAPEDPLSSSPEEETVLEELSPTDFYYGEPRNKNQTPEVIIEPLKIIPTPVKNPPADPWENAVIINDDLLYFYFLFGSLFIASIVAVGHERIQARKVQQIMDDLQNPSRASSAANEFPRRGLLHPNTFHCPELTLEAPALLR